MLRLSLAWLAIFAVLALMVLVPFVLYMRGSAIRNRLTFEVGAMELAVERAARAMADRERAMRAFLYRPDPLRLEEHRAAGVALRAALASAQVLAQTEGEPWTRDVERLIGLEREWELASAGLIARASAGEGHAPELPHSPRAAPVYADFQSVAARLLAALDLEKNRLVRELASADSARLAMPLWLALLGVTILLYVGRLSLDVVRLLGAASAEQERLTRVLEHMVDPVLVTDRHGIVTLANPAARSLLGVQGGEPIRAIASRLRALEPPDPELAAPARMTPPSILAAIAAAEPLGGIEVLVRDGAEERYVGVTSAPIAVRGEIAGAVSVLRDLSDRVHYERERLKTERFQALGAMAERLAHDFGNYLEAASAATAMLERPSASSDPERRMRWVSLIRTTIDEGRNVLAGLRTLSFISHRRPRFAAVDLREVSQRATDIARMSRPDAGAIEIAIEVPAGLHVAASESELVRALVNVLVNALDATAASGRVEVRASSDGDHALLALRDTGVGIPPEHYERIFDMYFTTKGERGSGMGLALAREVVHLHGGEILVESTPGEGSTFTLVLPLAPRRGQPAGESASCAAGAVPEEVP